MTTGCARIAMLVAVLALAGGCAARQPDAILSAAELDAMISVEVTLLEPAEPTATVAMIDQP